MPTALVSAELATGKGWESGGVYKWCSLAFGKRWGFFAVFLQWFQVTVGFVVMLYFIVNSISYILDFSDLRAEPWLKFLSAIFIFWILTFIALKGSKFAAKVASYGFILGTLLPLIALVLLSAFYIFQNNPIYLSFSWSTFFPNFDDASYVSIFVSFILVYAGIEVSAENVNKMENPSKNYPLALVLIIIIAILSSILGSLSIALVIPA